MSYLPWPQEGCSLKAARERTADRTLWRRWLDESATASDCEIEDKLNIALQEMMARGDLVAYGARSTDRPLELVDRAFWMQHVEISWKTSTVGEQKAAPAFHAVRVFPPLLSPDNAQLLNGRSLSEAFKECVLADPEVAVMGRRAIELSPSYACVFRDGRRTKYGVAQWPVACDRWILTGAVHPDPEKRGTFDGPDADPLEVFMAAEALEHRYRCLMKLLGSGELEAVGVSASSGSIETLPRSIWSHEDFWIDADGNVLQETEQASRAQRRWVGVLLRRTPVPVAALSQKAIANDRLPSTAGAGTSNSSANGHQPLISAADALAAGDLATALRVLILSHSTVERLRAQALATGVCARGLEEEAGLIVHFPGFDTPIMRFREIEVPSPTGTTSLDPADEFYPTPNRTPECQAYCDALRSRADGFFGLLQRGEVVGFGHVTGGALIEISRSIWSHGDYCANPRTGDIFEMGSEQHVRVWSAVTLKPGEMFHVGPTTFDQPPSTTTAPNNRAKSQQATPSRIVTTNIAIRECTDWIEQIIRSNPNQRTESRASLWQKAQQRWPKTLSQRSFLAARAEAIRRTENTAWNTGGAPRKNRRGKTEASE